MKNLLLFTLECPLWGPSFLFLSREEDAPFTPPKKAEKIVPKTNLFAVLNSADLGGRETDRPTFFALRTPVQDSQFPKREGGERKGRKSLHVGRKCLVKSDSRLGHERRATGVSLQKKDCGGGGCTLWTSPTKCPKCSTGVLLCARRPVFPSLLCLVGSWPRSRRIKSSYCQKIFGSHCTFLKNPTFNFHIILYLMTISVHEWICSCFPLPPAS